MEQILTLLFNMLGPQTPVHVQRLAEKTAHLALDGDANTDTRQVAHSTLMALAKAGDLDVEVRAALRSSPVPEVRAAVWTRDDVTLEDLRELVAGEKRASVLAKLLEIRGLPQEFVNELCSNMRTPIARVLMDRGVPEASREAHTAAAQLLARSFYGMSAKAREELMFSFSRRRVDADALLVDERNIDPLLRLAACANPGADIAVVEEHFATLLEALGAAMTHLSYREREARFSLIRVYLDRLADRGDVTPAMLDIYRAATVDVSLHSGTGAWHAALNPVKEKRKQQVKTAAEQLEEDLAAATTPAALRAVFDALSPKWRKEFASTFATSWLCDTALAADVLPLVDPRERWSTRGLWTYQAEEPFKEAVRNDDSAVAHIIAHLDDTDVDPTLLPARATLFGWLLDVICHERDDDRRSAILSHPSGYGLDRWMDLLQHEDFPTDRYEELPLFVVAHATRFRGRTPDWLWDAVTATLAQFEDLPVELSTKLLTDLVDDSAPFGSVAAGVAGGLRAA